MSSRRGRLKMYAGVPVFTQYCIFPLPMTTSFSLHLYPAVGNNYKHFWFQTRWDNTSYDSVLIKYTTGLIWLLVLCDRVMLTRVRWLSTFVLYSGYNDDLKKVITMFYFLVCLKRLFRNKVTFFDMSQFPLLFWSHGVQLMTSIAQKDAANHGINISS